ncbi:DCST1 ligase, partial [Nothoprocta ornata]|nr:DCST1 ligase [Nothoprocta ornata]
KRTLLPLRRAEAPAVVFPGRLGVQPLELQSMVVELLNCIPPLLLLLLAWGLDRVLFMVLGAVRQHSFVQYSFRSSHHLELRVAGTSLLARLLRSTVGALNTSSHLHVDSSNLGRRWRGARGAAAGAAARCSAPLPARAACLPQPRAMTTQGYVDSCLPLALLALLCLVQVYTYRLRRVLAAFFFPKREKRRVLFLYNQLLRQRQCFVQLQRRRVARRAQQRQGLGTSVLERCCRRWPALRRYMRRRCVVCEEPEGPRSRVCAAPACAAVYCGPCW